MWFGNRMESHSNITGMLRGAWTKHSSEDGYVMAATLHSYPHHPIWHSWTFHFGDLWQIIPPMDLQELCDRIINTIPPVDVTFCKKSVGWIRILSGCVQHNQGQPYSALQKALSFNRYSVRNGVVTPFVWVQHIFKVVYLIVIHSVYYTIKCDILWLTILLQNFLASLHTWRNHYSSHKIVLMVISMDLNK
jgi:hypothetical protein